MTRQTLTVQDLAALCERAAGALDEARSQHDPAARQIVDELRGVALLAQDVVLSSGQGCAADAVLLELPHEDDALVVCVRCGAELLYWQQADHVGQCPGGTALPHAFRVWFRFVDEDRRTARAALFDATSAAEAQAMVERRYAGEAAIVVISAEDLDAQAVRS